jgi:hypothetical protein
MPNSEALAERLCKNDWLYCFLEIRKARYVFVSHPPCVHLLLSVLLIPKEYSSMICLNFLEASIGFHVVIIQPCYDADNIMWSVVISEAIIGAASTSSLCTLGVTSVI